MTEYTQKAPKEKIDNSRILNQTGLKIMHIRSNLIGGRHVTVAFKPPRTRHHNLEIATAITHPNDVFTKKVGTKIAVENFIAGKTISVPNNYQDGPVGLLYTMFGD